MNRNVLKPGQKRGVALGVAAMCAIAACGAAWAAKSASWSLNGRYVSSNVRMIGGQAYVPLSDVARSMNLKVVKSGSTYALKVAGGATQVNGVLQGVIGDQLSTGKWGFQVTGVQEATEYSERYSQEGRQVTPKNSGEKLIVIDAVLRNNLQKTQTPMLTERYCENTALTDDQGQSFAPVDIDARQESSKIGSYGSVPMLPASKMKIALVFSVPQETKIKALVFSALGYPDNVGRKGVDLRVSLK